MMQAIRRNNLTGIFTWIGSDGWGARKNAYEGNEPEVHVFLELKINLVWVIDSRPSVQGLIN